MPASTPGKNIKAEMFKTNEAPSKSFRGGRNFLQSVSSQVKASNVKQKSGQPLKTLSAENNGCSSSSVSSVLSAANRFPYSSTPAVSPTQHLKLKSETTVHSVHFESESNENFKIPLASNQTDYSLKSGKMSNKFPGDDSVSISPIRKDNNSEVYFQTQMRSINVSYDSLLRPTSASAEMNSPHSLWPRLSSTLMSQPEQNKIPNMPLFPFPNVQTYKKIDKGETLLNSLRTLKVVRTLQMEKERLENRKDIQDQSIIKGSKKDLLKMEESSFPFTADMFKYVNSQACLHVLHLLFECYDPKETEILFRDAWPVYEKKLEGVFRRVALKWLREIMEEHPQFFPFMKQEAVGGLLVNPGGERFIQLLESFVQLVLFRIADTKTNGDESIIGVIRKPQFVDDSEITNRQIFALNKVSDSLKNDTIKVRRQTLKNSSEVNKSITVLRQRKDMYLIEESEIEKKVEHLLGLVGETVIMTNDNESDHCCDQLKSVLPRMNEKVIRINAGAENALMASSLKVLQVMKALDKSNGKYKRLWYILGMDRNRERVLDGSKLFCLNGNETTIPSLNGFIKTIEDITNQFLSDESLNAALPSPIVVKHKTAELKFQYLKIIQQETSNRTNRVDLSNLTKDIEYKKKSLEVELKDVNWHEYSKVDEDLTKNKAFSITPTKGYDFKKQTGYTPALLNFLPESSDETDSTSYRNISNVPLRLNISQVRREFGNASGNFAVGLEQKTTCHLSSSVVSPVSRFKSIGEKSTTRTIPKVKIDVAANLSTPDTPQDKYQRLIPIPVMDREDTVEAVEVSTVNVSINVESSSLDVSFRSDSMTPVGLDFGTQARIARIMGSLNDTPQSSTVQPIPFEAKITCRESVGSRLSTEVMTANNRISLASLQASNSELNLSLMDDWNDEKGIMDVSYTLDESDSD